MSLAAGGIDSSEDDDCGNSGRMNEAKADERIDSAPLCRPAAISKGPPHTRVYDGLSAGNFSPSGSEAILALGGFDRFDMSWPVCSEIARLKDAEKTISSPESESESPGSKSSSDTSSMGKCLGIRRDLLSTMVHVCGGDSGWVSSECRGERIRRYRLLLDVPAASIRIAPLRRRREVSPVRIRSERTIESSGKDSRSGEEMRSSAESGDRLRKWYVIGIEY